jgi:phage terminase small subunit
MEPYVEQGEVMSSRRSIETRASEIEESHGRKLTNRQKEFARYYVEGTHSNASCARMAGYSDKNGIAKIQACKLLDPSTFPHVAEYISELREDRERKYGVTLIGQLQRFSELSRSAEDNGQFSAAVNAEKIRSSLGGLTIDRRETSHFHAIEAMSREQIEDRLKELRGAHPGAFIEAEYEEVNGAETRDVALEQIEAKDPPALERDAD